MRILDSAQMRAADLQTINELGVPSIVLMENAGRQVAQTMLSDIDDLANKRIVVLCGRGSNGGDGFVVARTLLQEKINSTVFLFGQLNNIQGDAKTNLNILTKLGIKILEIQDLQTWEEYQTEIIKCDVIVDALCGTGLNKPIEGLLKTVVSDVNSVKSKIVSIDLPTGLSADSNIPIGDFIKATCTVTLATPKLPLVLFPSNSCVGNLVVADIGIPITVIKDVDGLQLDLLTPQTIRNLIPKRKLNAHKGDFGRILVVAGSIGKTGAACLAGSGALRSGAGLVTVATPVSCVGVVAKTSKDYMTLPLEEREKGSLKTTALSNILNFSCDVIAIGPGLGTGDSQKDLVRSLVDQSNVPVVLDADALNAFIDDSKMLKGRSGKTLVVTPHPGEMGRLLNIETELVQRNRVELAIDFARKANLFVVLKGSQTVIATPEGAAFINPTGNPGMATGGTGDVLTGMIAAWIGQLGDIESACKVAVYLHGLAGDLAASSLGEVALTASDIINSLGEATQKASTNQIIKNHFRELYSLQ